MGPLILEGRRVESRCGHGGFSGDRLEVVEGDLGHGRDRDGRFVVGGDRLDFGQGGQRGGFRRVEFFDVSKRGDLEQVAVLLGG